MPRQISPVSIRGGRKPVLPDPQARPAALCTAFDKLNGSHERHASARVSEDSVLLSGLFVIVFPVRVGGGNAHQATVHIPHHHRRRRFALAPTLVGRK